ncbi:MAG: cbb3-type cytochrome oxidase subunit 3 [Ostreibacterium sp.]
MKELPTILLICTFIGMCILLLFTKNSKTYKDAASLPLDEDVKEKLKAEKKED